MFRPTKFLKFTFSSREFCNFLETRPNSDQIKASIKFLSAPILWFWWHARFSGLANSDHAQKPFFTGSNEPNIFALPPPDVADLHARFIWQNAIAAIGGDAGHQGDICTPERSSQSPIHQQTLPPHNRLSQYHISPLLSQYRQKRYKKLNLIITFIIKRRGRYNWNIKWSLR